MAVAVVVGGGFSGVVAARELVRTGWSVIMVDPQARPGRGVAYSTAARWHLLNSPVSAMSVDPDRPGDFLEWCRRRDSHTEGSDFVARGWYGDYLTEALRAVDEVAPGKLTVHRGTVGRIFEASHTGLTVLLTDSVVLTADAVVLAVGNAAPRVPVAADESVRQLSAYIQDPWQEDVLARVGDGPVLLIGTGLTAVDVALSLAGREITAVSRHGLLPRAHAPSVRREIVPPAATSVAALLHWVRDQAAATGDWRGVMDGLRPHWDRMWRGLPEHEQRRFLRHVARYWEVHRHRMAPQVAASVEERRQDGSLRVRAGEVCGLRPLPDGRIEAVIKGTRLETRAFTAVVNCTGPGRLTERDPLVRSLVADGLAAPGPHELGLAVDEHGAVLGRSHRAPALFALGSARRGRLWETTAAPEIREQARALALHLLTMGIDRESADQTR
ncbi:MAG: FAD-dependent oxidoreductase [Hamadaea sp.]|uniref:FAD/NAD(P)-binding protein n=1 Tax=Hamadaea sp. TaxID=2024425 RepID=UPI0017F060AB|nr:FAD-dependent oxidoreductase [Hamadaea sp.]NUT20431.1 FAD-dependent oxidoreductase [Hamadaea sp.]